MKEVITMPMPDDNYHTSAYALGYMAEKIKPRIAVASHLEYDPQQLRGLSSGVTFGMADERSYYDANA